MVNRGVGPASRPQGDPTRPSEAPAVSAPPVQCRVFGEKLKPRLPRCSIPAPPLSSTTSPPTKVPATPRPGFSRSSRPPNAQRGKNLGRSHRRHRYCLCALRPHRVPRLPRGCRLGVRSKARRSNDLFFRIWTLHRKSIVSGTRSSFDSGLGQQVKVVGRCCRITRFGLRQTGKA